MEISLIYVEGKGNIVNLRGGIREISLIYVEAQWKHH
jgi:hypothetical protein